MDSNKIKVILITFIAMVIALYLGISSATAQLETIVWMVGTSVLLVCLMLGRNIWMLVPLLGALGLTFRVPGLPTSILLAHALLIGFTIMLFLMRKLPYQLRISELEIWAVILLLFVGQVYLRNPTGLNLFGGDTVGGRSYIVFGVTLLSAFVFFGYRIPPERLMMILKLHIIGGIISFAMFVFGLLVPSIGIWYGAGGAVANESSNAAPNPERSSRIGFIGNMGKNMSLWLSSFISPLKALVSLFWLPVLMLSLGFAAMSGFRNTIAAVALTYCLGVMYRGGFVQVVASFFVGLVGLGAIALINVAMPLPPNVQRSLGFLPGTWAEEHVLDGKNSTEWRVEIWKEVLLTDRWIQNKWFGDGLGFTAAELSTQMNLKEAKGLGISGFDVHRETILANGDYHSGPVQTIRVIGYIGLVFLLLAQLRLAVHAHRQIIRCRHSEWFPLALLVCIPLVWAPLYFVFIFGSFEIGASSFLMGAAFVRVLENNLPLPRYLSSRERRYFSTLDRSKPKAVTA
jgi:hypothetical protein